MNAAATKINHVNFGLDSYVINITIIHKKCNHYIDQLQNHYYLLQSDKDIFTKFINVCRQYWISTNSFMVDLVYVGGSAIIELFKTHKIDDSGDLDVSRFRKFFTNHLNSSEVESELASLFAGASEMSNRILMNNALWCYTPFSTDLFPYLLGG
jgi:hypothetical protein